jgi:eukaryotic-like serine/threonine-protein kinase
MAETAGSARGIRLTTGMGPAEWDQVLEIFHAAREKSGSERISLLDAACGEKTPLRAAVEELLKEDEAADGFLSKPVFESITGEVCQTLVISGQHFGRYVIGELLGSGGMGEVWSAQDTDLDRPVALKFLSSKALAVLDTDQLIREAKAASALNHPNIVTIHEVVQSESTLAIVMELVEGVPLRQLTGKALPTTEVLEIGSQIARALAAAHGGNIVHGDIKPENILLRRDRYVKVLDFGLARKVNTETIASIGSPGLGTLRYMSPEQARGEPLTPASDIFSFGLVLYELATGTHAFPASSPVDTVRAILTNNPSPPSLINQSIPGQLDSVIRAMLTKDPRARPPAEEVARQLSVGASSIEAPERRPDAAETVRPLRQLERAGDSSRRWYRQIAAVAALATVSFGGFWLSRQQQHKPSPIKLTPVPLTTAPGFHSWPDISPDGEAVVYGWGASPDAYTDLYLQRFDQDAPVKLVEAEPGSRIGHAKWSPDGQHIYYKRVEPDNDGIWVVSNHGSDRHKIVSLSNAELSSAIDCSPDGKRIAYSEGAAAGTGRFGLQSLNLISHERMVLTAPKEGWGDWDPRFSPDAKMIAFKRVKAPGDDQLYVMPAAGGRPTQITSGRHSIYGHAWLTQRKLLVSIQLSSVIHGLWRISADGSGSPDSVFESGFDATMPAVGKTKIVWIDYVNDFNIYSVPLAGGTAVRRIASAMYDSQPALAPDERIAYVSRRSGRPEIWIAAPDASTEIRLTNLEGDVAHPAWSPDGSRIVFSVERSGVTTIFSVACPPGALRCASPARLVEGAYPTWSADSKFVYFTANTQGQIRKVPISGGPATYVVSGLEALPSRDGKWLYFRRVNPAPEFWRVRLGADGAVTGPEERVLVSGDNGANLNHWTLAGDEILFWESSINSRFSGLRAYNTVTKRFRTVVETPTAEYPAVSADGKTVWFAKSDAAGARVMAAEFSQ